MLAIRLSRPAVPLVSVLLVLTGCQLHLLDRDRDDDNGNGGDGSASITLLAAEGGGYNDFVLTLSEVEFRRPGGGRTRVEFAEQDFGLFAGIDGILVSTGIELPSGDYNAVRLTALDGMEFLDGSFVDNQVPLEIPGDTITFDTSYQVRTSGSNDFILVINTMSALLPSTDDDGNLFYRFRPAGYMVRSDRAGYVEGSIAGCAGAGVDEIAVYVFREDANPRDIRGPAGSENDPVVAFTAQTNGDYISPPLPAGDWQFSYTCNALDDDPETTEDDITDELRGNVQSHTVERGEPSQATTLNF